MSTAEPQQDAPQPVEEDAPMQEEEETPSTKTAQPQMHAKSRPRLNFSVLGAAGGERKRGKSMFGVLVNTLNKAKAEDKARNASEAAKKRQLIEQRLQSKLKKETDSVRRAEEAKKDKVTGLRKEEDLQLKDSIQKLRRIRTPLLANFLLTSDEIPDVDVEPTPAQLSATVPRRSHPPPLYYLPAVLTPSQEAFLAKRQVLAKETAEKEWEGFKAERTTGIDEITTLRRKAAELEESRKAEAAAKEAAAGNGDTAKPAPNGDVMDEEPREEKAEEKPPAEESREAVMEVDDGKDTPKPEGKDEREPEPELEKKDERAAVGDEDDAVEY